MHFNKRSFQLGIAAGMLGGDVKWVSNIDPLDSGIGTITYTWNENTRGLSIEQTATSGGGTYLWDESESELNVVL